MNSFKNWLLGVVIISMPVTYLVSLIYCISNSEWMAAIFMHVFLFPVGIIHGWFVLFGASWF